VDEETPLMRRSPRQARGKERVARLLDAAEALFGEVGYEAASTNQIAARAGVPIGSLYQFFPNKEAIVGAVALRYQEGAATALSAALGPRSAELAPEALAACVLEAMIAYGSARLGFTRIVLQAGADPHLAGAAAAIMDIAAAHLEAILAMRRPALPPSERSVAARVAMTAVMALLALVTAEKQRGPEHIKAIIAEAQQLLAAYLAAIDERARAGRAQN
jgi:AcrR family transcriptional regulator